MIDDGGLHVISNAQAALLIRMVAQFPDMVQRLEAV
jgi:hypothetical protein